MKLSFIKQKYVIYGLLFIIILFNLYLYRNEFKVTSDPNDNNFHYALIDEAKNIWRDIFTGKISPVYLFDSFNERWAEGFPLSSYYTHLPQALISLLSFIIPLPTYQLFVIIRTLLLILLPISFFLAVRIMDLPLIYGLMVAFFTQTIFTDGLYGIDLSSFLWRGWGLSAQLLAVFFLPLAFVYTLRYLEKEKDFLPAVIFNFIVAQAHFGIFFLLALTYPLYLFFSLEKFVEIFKRLLLFTVTMFLLLSYFLWSYFLQSNYRNFSYWDSIWKFNSWGMNQVMTWLFNGNLFDFNRLPIISLLVLIGLLFFNREKKKLIWYFCLCFNLFLILFFGRTTLGSIIDFIPGFSEYHLHRLIIMIHFFGIFLAGWASYLIITRLLKQKFVFFKILGLVISITLIIILEKPVLKYAQDNNTWIEMSNKNYQKDIASYQKIVDKLKQLPKGRVYAGRPGNWGREFKIADTQIYMALSRDGFPITGFLPESWSPNSDSEQFFNEDSLEFCQLYKVNYLVYPQDKRPPAFAELVSQVGRFTLYQVPDDGWFRLGRSDLLVSGKKTDLLNITHLWLNGSFLQANQFPEISFDQKNRQDKDQIIMTDLNSYQDQDKNINIFQNNPLLIIRGKSFNKALIEKKDEKVLTNGYQITVELKDDCSKCLLVLKQTYHPNWQVTINGKKSRTYPVFPFYLGIPVEKKGSYKVIAVYKPATIKIILIWFEIIFFILIVFRKTIFSFF